MAYLAIAYPDFSKPDLAWIQEYRKDYDKRSFGIVPPHFTLVFSITDIRLDVFVREIETQLIGVREIDFELAVATVNRNNSENYYHEFLVPEKGHAAIIKLHDRLYR